MPRRVVVSAACNPTCSDCEFCRPGTREPELEALLTQAQHPEIVLGGGDATKFSRLAELVAGLRNSSIFLEAPCGVLDRATCDRLGTLGVHGVVAHFVLEQCPTPEEIERIVELGEASR